MNEKFAVWLKVPKSPIHNNQAVVKITACLRKGDKPLLLLGIQRVPVGSFPNVAHCPSTRDQSYQLVTAVKSLWVWTLGGHYLHRGWSLCNWTVRIFQVINDGACLMREPFKYHIVATGMLHVYATILCLGVNSTCQQYLGQPIYRIS